MQLVGSEAPRIFRFPLSLVNRRYAVCLVYIGLCAVVYFGFNFLFVDKQLSFIFGPSMPRAYVGAHLTRARFCRRAFVGALLSARFCPARF